MVNAKEIAVIAAVSAVTFFVLTAFVNARAESAAQQATALAV